MEQGRQSGGNRACPFLGGEESASGSQAGCRLGPGAGKILYVLRLEDGSFYVGKTNNLERRIRQHSGEIPGGAQICLDRGFTPLQDGSNYWSLEGCDGHDENFMTIRMMAKHNIESVFGGAWCSSRIKEANREFLERLMHAAHDLCYNCGGDHFIQDCTEYHGRAQEGQYVLYPATTEEEAEDESDDEDGDPPIPVQPDGPDACELVDIFDRLYTELSQLDSLRIASMIEVQTRLPSKVLDLGVINHLSEPAKGFLLQYEKGLVDETRSSFKSVDDGGGFYEHQHELLCHLGPDAVASSSADHSPHHMLLTCSTGTGKSLCFWTWLIHHLTSDGSMDSTAIVAFPTQALLWSQADRISRISSSCDSFFLSRQKRLPYGGILELGGQQLSWSVWHGQGRRVTRDSRMARHVRESPSFQEARIYITTLDNVHWNLAKSRVGNRILKNLRCVVLDEVHLLDGNLGANTHYLLQRLAISKQLLQVPSDAASEPRVFLASATVGDAHTFASKLLGTPQTNIKHIKDSNAAARVISPLQDATAVRDSLAGHYDAQGSCGQLRIILTVEGKCEPSVIASLCTSPVLGNRVRALIFSGSKRRSKKFAAVLRADGTVGGPMGRAVKVYDADLPPFERRLYEISMNELGGRQGLTVCGTSALEVGVDISNLDVCVDTDIPADRMSLLQRVGRVGRNSKIPSLVLLFADPSKPCASALLRNPVSHLSAETHSLLLPLSTETTVVAALRCCLEEAMLVSSKQSNHTVCRHWWSIVHARLAVNPSVQQLLEVLGLEATLPAALTFNDLSTRLLTQFCKFIGASASEVSSDGDRWFFSPFRDGSTLGMSQGNQVPLVECRDKGDGTLVRRNVLLPDGEKPRPKHAAWIDRMRLLTTAHPNAVYLGHTGKKYKILSYRVQFPGRHTKLEMIMRHIHNRYGIVGQEQRTCSECRSIVISRGLDRTQIPSPRECRYRTPHFHSEGDEYCRDCFPLSPERLTPCDQCPLNSKNYPTCSPGQWLSCIQEVMVIEMVNEDAAESDTIGYVSQRYARMVPDMLVSLPLADNAFRYTGITYRRWEVQITWLGYQQGNQPFQCAETVQERMGRSRALRVSWEAVIEKPFTEPTTYRTVGFEWVPQREPGHGAAADKKLLKAASYVVRHRVCSVIECEPEQLNVDMGAREPSEGGKWSMRVIDTSPGGSGRSWAALARGAVFGVNLAGAPAQFHDMHYAWKGRTGTLPLMHGFISAEDIQRLVSHVRSKEEEENLKTLENETDRDRVSALLSELVEIWTEI